MPTNGRSAGLSRGYRITAGFFCAVFILSAAVQWNDPDPLAWIALYGLAATLAGAGAIGRLPVGPNIGAAGLFVLLTLLWMPSLGGARSEAFTSFELKASRDERPRETVGLAICAGFSVLQAAIAWRHRPR